MFQFSFSLSSAVTECFIFVAFKWWKTLFLLSQTHNRVCPQKTFDGYQQSRSSILCSLECFFFEFLFNFRTTIFDFNHDSIVILFCCWTNFFSVVSKLLYFLKIHIPNAHTSSMSYKLLQLLAVYKTFCCFLYCFAIDWHIYLVPKILFK